MKQGKKRLQAEQEKLLAKLQSTKAELQTVGSATIPERGKSEPLTRCGAAYEATYKPHTYSSLDDCCTAARHNGLDPGACWWPWSSRSCLVLLIAKHYAEPHTSGNNCHQWGPR